MNHAADTGLITAAWAGMPLAEGPSGDLPVVISGAKRAIVAVIDGLGHGSEAALAAQVAAEIVSTHAAATVAELCVSCHEGLRKTRGVVMTIASFELGSSVLEWCGVGNVDAVLFHLDPAAPRAREALATRGGVLGHRLPPLKVGSQPLWPGDLLVLASDGIRSGFSEHVQPTADPQTIADQLLETCGKSTDDALVLAARYNGGPRD